MTADPPPPSLENLDARLDDLRRRAGLAREGGKEQSAAPPRDSAMGLGLRVGVELVVGVAVGGGIGWGLDSWLGTRPFLFLLFFLLGAAAGMLNVYRAVFQIPTPADEARHGRALEDAARKGPQGDGPAGSGRGETD